MGANGNGEIKGLDNDFINDLLSGSRQKGIYGVRLHDWLEKSDEAAIDPQLVWPADFSGKTASGMSQSFKIAARKAELMDVEGKADTIRVITRGEKVYLVHMERVTAQADAEAEAVEA